MSFRSFLATLLSPDPPVQLNADWFLDKADRQRLDDQIRSLQAHAADSHLRGQHATWAIVHGSSPAGAAGDCLCVAPSVATEDDPDTALRYVTQATTTPMSTAGIVLGVALTAYTPGSWVRMATGGIIGPGITGLAAGSNGPVRLNLSTGRLLRVASLASGNYPVGYVDSVGNLSLARGLAIP